MNIINLGFKSKFISKHTLKIFQSLHVVPIYVRVFYSYQRRFISRPISCLYAFSNSFGIT